MDKYDGCNVVETSVTAPEKPKTKKPRAVRRLIVKLAVAAALIGFICAVHFIPALDGVRSALRAVFLYDVFGRGGFGVGIFNSLT